MTDSDSDTDGDELYRAITNDRTKALVAERTVGDADRVDNPRTAIRYVGEDRGVDQFQVAFTKTEGFPLGKTSRSVQPENHIRDWIEKNDAELIDACEEEMFAPTASEESVGVALETDGGEDQDEPLQFDDLPGDAHDLLLDYKAEDESVAEALNRVFAGIVPHATHMPDDVDVEGDLLDQEFVIVHGRTADDYVEEIVYDDTSAFASTLYNTPENPEEVDF